MAVGVVGICLGAWLAMLPGCASEAQSVAADASPVDVIASDVAATADVPPVDGGAPNGGGIACRSTSDCYGGDFCASARECRAGFCVALNAPANCDDGLTCTLDACDASRGACTHQPLDRLCPAERFCDPTAGCVPPPSCEAGDTPCQRLNHDPCHGVWSCDPVSLRCTRSAAADCDDHNACTVDSCVNDGTIARCTREMPTNDCGSRVCGRSPSSCFSCGECASGECVDGACVDCPPCQVLSGGTCVPITDGTSCEDDRDVCTRDTCHAGRCVHGSVPNDCGAMACGTSPSGCFSCGTSCAAGQYCRAGICSSCPDCQRWDGTACVPMADLSACADDHDACTRDVCSAGACTHPMIANDCGARACGPSPTGCFACGASCIGGQVCNDGTCACGSGRALCDGACVDVGSSLAHCGACGAACVAPANAMAVCVAGECSFQCSAGYTRRGAACVPSCFSDDFNRPDADVLGNGWTVMGEFVGRSGCGATCSQRVTLHANSVDVSESAASSFSCGCGSLPFVMRAISNSLPITLQVDYVATRDQRIGATVGLATGATADGPVGLTGVQVFRSSASYDNSVISLIRNGASILSLPSPVQWTNAGPIHLSVTINANGSMAGAATQGGVTVPISAGAAALPDGLNYAAVRDTGGVSYDFFNTTMSVSFDNFSACP